MAKHKHQCNNSNGNDDNGNGDSSINDNNEVGWQQWPALKANANSDGMDEDGEGPKIKYRKIKYLLLHFMPS